MAFTGATLAQVLRSTLGVVIQGDGLLTEREVVLRTMRAVQTNVPGRYQEFQGVARSAMALYATGAPATFSGPNALRPQDHARDPSIRPGDPRYRYRVAVEITSETGDTYRTLSQIDSDTPLSYNQMRDMIDADVEGFASNRRSVRAHIAQMGPLDHISIVVLTAGRA